MMCLYDILAELPLAKTILQPWKQMSEIERCWPYKIYKEQTICDTHMPWKHDVLMEHFPARLGISASLTAESLPHSHYHGPAPKWAWPWETPYCPDQASFQKSTFMGQKKESSHAVFLLNVTSGATGDCFTTAWSVLVCTHQHNTSHITGCISLTCQHGTTQTEGRGKLRDQVEHT